MAHFKVLLFDLDDTLLHFDDYWEASMKETFRRHSSTRELDVERLFERLWEQNAIFAELYHRQQITIRQFRNFRFMHALSEFGRPVDEAVADDFNELHRTISRTFMKADATLLELLTDLNRTYSLGIVTNGTASWQYDKIEAMGVRPLFPEGSIIISEEAGYEKPAPEIYRRALSFFEASPEDVLFVGDSWSNDVTGPYTVGIRSVWLNKNREPVPDSPTPYGVITDILELKNYLSANTQGIQG